MEFNALVARLNALYHKSKEKPLDPGELAERDRLRREYLAVMRAQVKSSFDRVQIVDEHGNAVRPGSDSRSHSHSHQHSHCGCEHDSGCDCGRRHPPKN